MSFVILQIHEVEIYLFSFRSYLLFMTFVKPNRKPVLCNNASVTYNKVWFYSFMLDL